MTSSLFRTGSGSQTRKWTVLGQKPSYWFSQSHNGRSAFIHSIKETVYHHISTEQSIRRCKCCQYYESLLYLHYFTRQTGNMFRTDKQMHSLRRNIMHVISLAVSKTLGHFAISRRKTHYAAHIYILFNICQTFINYKLMKCSTVLGDRANEDIDFCFWHVFVRFNTILSITLY